MTRGQGSKRQREEEVTATGDDLPLSILRNIMQLASLDDSVAIDASQDYAGYDFR